MQGVPEGSGQRGWASWARPPPRSAAPSRFPADHRAPSRPGQRAGPCQHHPRGQKTPPESPCLLSCPLTVGMSVAWQGPRDTGCPSPLTAVELDATVFGLSIKFLSHTHFLRPLPISGDTRPVPLNVPVWSGLAGSDVNLDILTQVTSEKTPRGTQPRCPPLLDAGRSEEQRGGPLLSRHIHIAGTWQVSGVPPKEARLCF